GTSAVWSTAKTVSYGGYGATEWWDYWPCGFFDGTDAWVFFTTETDNGPSFSDGEIAFAKMDWDLSNDHYFFVQNGIDQATGGDAVHVAAGTYREQLYIDKSLDLLGSGSGDCIIEAPDPGDRSTYTITQWTGSVKTIDAVIGVNAAGTVNIDGFNIDGRDTGPGNFYGICFFDTDCSLTNCIIDNITYSASPGTSSIVSVLATHSLGATFTIDITGNTVPIFQKGG
ncbi:MAG: hypothetical protein GY869_00120, partial [Planctomycetes bacterium]|nr:hypothetical protein [Planctomycetota bacterium]